MLETKKFGKARLWLIINQSCHCGQPERQLFEFLSCQCCKTSFFVEFFLSSTVVIRLGNVVCFLPLATADRQQDRTKEMCYFYCLDTRLLRAAKFYLTKNSCVKA